MRHECYGQKKITDFRAIRATYRIILLLLPMLTVLGACGESEAPAQPAVPGAPLPNVIVIVLDTLRFDFTSLADETLGTTPRLQELARHGVVFENAYSTTDSTPPSHFSIFTGLKRGLLGELDRPEIGFPYHMKKLGYHSLGISANANVGPKTMRAVKVFDSFFSPVEKAILEGATASERTAIQSQVRKVLDHNNAPFTRFTEQMIVSSAENVNRFAARKLAEIQRPALLFFNFMDAHDPYFVPDNSYDCKKEERVHDYYPDLRTRLLPLWMYEPERIESETQRREYAKRLGPLKPRRWCLSDDLTEAHIALYRDRYSACLRYLDRQIGHLIDMLKSKGLYDNSIIFITSDHGESFGEKKYMTHSLHNKGNRQATRHVPLLVLPENKPRESKRISEEVSIADISPTLYEMLGIDDTAMRVGQKKNYGRSLIPLMRNASPKRKKQYKISVSDAVPPSDDRAEEELQKSLKALGYIL